MSYSLSPQCGRYMVMRIQSAVALTYRNLKEIVRFFNVYQLSLKDSIYNYTCSNEKCSVELSLPTGSDESLNRLYETRWPIDNSTSTLQEVQS